MTQSTAPFSTRRITDNSLKTPVTPSNVLRVFCGNCPKVFMKGNQIMRKIGKIWGVDVMFWHIVAAFVGAAVIYYGAVMFIIMGGILTS